MPPSDIHDNLFPCPQVPDEPDRQKLIGIYRQLQEGLMLQRVKIPGGRLSGDQWRGLGRLAAELTPSAPLHLTTRQDVEFHDLAPEQIPALQQSLDRIALTCFAAAGDTFRNVTVCPCSGTLAGRVDLMPLALQIRNTLAEIDGIYSLPRKFKISLSCGPDCGQPWINDLGLVVGRRGEQLGFRVVAGGSLGSKPGTGLELLEWTAADDMLPLAVAAVRFFAAHGDRTNRRRARLRHVRERMGDDEFTAALLEAFETAGSEHQWPAADIPTDTGRFEAGSALTFPNGDVTPAAAESLGQIADEGDFAVRIANQHRVILFAHSARQLREMLDSTEPLRQAAKAQPAVVACPGKRWCTRALAHTNELADRIRSELSDRVPGGATVCISGCPNGCAHPAVADVGLVGRRITTDNGPVEAFDVLAGGGMGTDDRLAVKVADAVPADELSGRLVEALTSGGNCK